MKSAEWGSYEDAPRLVTDVPGPESLKMLADQDRYETASRTYTSVFKIGVSRARGSTIEDVDGNRFIDFFSGVSVINLGHGFPPVRNAIRDQLDKVVHINEMPTETRINFLKTFNSTLPARLKDHSKTMFTVTGAEACETAIELARHVTGRKTIVAFSGSYHGVSGEIISATSNPHYRGYAGIGLRDIAYIPYPYAYRFPFHVKREDMSAYVGDMLRHMISDPYAGPGEIGGVIVEPIQGEGGYVVPPDDFLPVLREITEDHGVPLILDEVQSGVGRSGRIWASEYTKVSPDIMCVSKSIGEGIPISMISYKDEYDEKLPPGFHLGTYRGNPLGMAAGNATLNYLRESSVLDTVRSNGSHLLNRLEEFAQNNRYVGEVRGRGYMIAMEMVDDPATKKPGTKKAARIKEYMFKHGVLMHTCGHYSNVLRFMAPLTIEPDLADRGIDILGDALKEVS